MALSYPEKVISLVLVCPITWSAELRNQPQPFKEEDRKRWEALSENERVRMWLAGVLSEDFLKKNPEYREKLIKIIKKGYGPPYAQNRHAHASNTYDNYRRLPLIKAPAIIIGGSADKTVTPNNMSILRARLPGAEVTIMDNMPHFLMWEGFDEFNRIMLDFLRRHPSTGSG
jgi:pimeloyl-ACP methyl ester carboxylesterase